VVLHPQYLNILGSRINDYLFLEHIASSNPQANQMFGPTHRPLTHHQYATIKGKIQGCQHRPSQNKEAVGNHRLSGFARIEAISTPLLWAFLHGTDSVNEETLPMQRGHQLSHCVSSVHNTRCIEQQPAEHVVSH
jgi:hypothetical protein